MNTTSINPPGPPLPNVPPFSSIFTNLNNGKFDSNIFPSYLNWWGVVSEPLPTNTNRSGTRTDVTRGIPLEPGETEQGEWVSLTSQTTWIRIREGGSDQRGQEGVQRKVYLTTLTVFHKQLTNGQVIIPLTPRRNFPPKLNPESMVKTGAHLVVSRVIPDTRVRTDGGQKFTGFSILTRSVKIYQSLFFSFTSYKALCTFNVL